jgi:hypothetical protein
MSYPLSYPKTKKLKKPLHKTMNTNSHLGNLRPHIFGCRAAVESASPLPKGEGPGEGERDARQPVSPTPTLSESVPVSSSQ